MIATENQDRLNYFRVAWQSALAAALCLGLPAGLLLWLILFQQTIHSVVVDQSIKFLQANGLISIFVLAICSLMWSFLLARISGYRPWWKIGFATAFGIFIGWFSPLSNLDGVFADQFPIHTLYAIAMCGIVSSATLSVGFAYGLILRNMRAALTLALTTSLVSALTLLLTIIFFDQFGIRVGGTIHLAMPKVTVSGLLTSAITGGMALGVGFTRFVRKAKRQVPVEVRRVMQL
jgi:hypothetical protein